MGSRSLCNSKSSWRHRRTQLRNSSTSSSSGQKSPYRSSRRCTGLAVTSSSCSCCDWRNKAKSRTSVRWFSVSSPTALRILSSTLTISSAILSLHSLPIIAHSSELSTSVSGAQPSRAGRSPTSERPSARPAQPTQRLSRRTASNWAIPRRSTPSSSASTTFSATAPTLSWSPRALGAVWSAGYTPTSAGCWSWTGTLGGLVVGEAHRRGGIGARLVAAAERWAEEQGCNTLFVPGSIVRRRIASPVGWAMTGSRRSMSWAQS